MPGLQRTLTAILVLGLIVAIHLPERAEAGATVEDRELVSKRRVGRGIYEYSYRLTINNVGTTLNDVNVYVSCDAPGTTIVDDIAEFGDIAENVVSTSTGTFSLRQNRRIPFDPECLQYEIGFATTVRLSGTATDKVLSGATIIGTVIRPSSGRPIIESGRPIIESFSTTADADGNYELEVEAVTEDDFITLEAQGTGDQEGAVLTSSVGSVGTLQEVGTSGSIIVGSGDFGALNVTHITTAQDELVRRLNGGVPPTNDAELAALQAQVDGAELLLLATTIKTVVDNPNVPLPPGINSTLELIQQDPAVVEAFTEALQTTFPTEFETALVETADELQLGYTPDQVVGSLYAIQPGNSPLQTSVAYSFNFDANGNGSVAFVDGSSPTTWSINSTGDIDITLLDSPVIESFPSCVYPGQINFQCRALITTEAIRIVRLADNLVTDQVFVLRTVRTTYPDDPLPDEVVEDTPAPDQVYLAFGNDGIIPVEPADIVDEQIALSYFHADNAAVLLGADPNIGADLLTFNADGSGATQRRGFNFTWSIDALGAVLVDFPNGDSNRYVLFDHGDAARAVLVGGVAGGATKALTTSAIDSDGITEFTNPLLEDRRYRAAWAITDPEFSQLDTFDFLFQQGGGGCRISGFEGANSSRRMEWVSTPENFMDSSLFLSPSDPNLQYQRRAWQAIRVEPGILGDRYWVIELLDFNNALDPNYQYADPATTPGRINAYEFIEDIGGQFDPCGLGTSDLLATLFASDNGAAGNMFDVTTLGDAIEVTAFDVNVDFAAGTDFDVTVYTTPDGFDNGVTTGIQGCLVNCVDVGAWTEIAAGTGTAAGVDQPSRVDVPPFILNGGATTGIWITLSRDGSIVDEFRYTNGGGSVNNADIVITFGAGVAAPDATTGLESVFLNRVWNGTIYYNTR